MINERIVGGIKGRGGVQRVRIKLRRKRKGKKGRGGGDPGRQCRRVLSSFEGTITSIRNYSHSLSRLGNRQRINPLDRNDRGTRWEDAYEIRYCIPCSRKPRLTIIYPLPEMEMTGNNIKINGSPR